MNIVSNLKILKVKHTIIIKNQVGYVLVFYLFGCIL